VKGFQVLLELFSPQCETEIVSVQNCRRADIALEALRQISSGAASVT